MSDASALAGKTVLLTRARAQSEELVALLEAHDAKPLVFPVIEISPPNDPAPFESVVAALSDYAWVVFTSANGVRATLAEIDRQALGEGAFGAAKIAVVGPATSRALEARGHHPALVAKELVGESLAVDLVAALAPHSRVVLLRAKEARDVVPDTLREAGHSVDVVTAYETHAAAPADTKKIADALGRGEIDLVTFTSSSTVESFCALLGDRVRDLLDKTCVVSIGPVTTATAEKWGLHVSATASPHTIPGLIDAMIGALTISKASR